MVFSLILHWCHDQDKWLHRIYLVLLFPDSFSDGDIEFWLWKYELCAEANEWKEDIMLKRLPTLLCGKAFAVFERLKGEQKASFKNVREALVAAFGGDATEMHIAMIEFRKQECKPEEDIQVFAYNLESLLRCAMPRLGANKCDILLKKTIYRRDKSCIKEKTFTAAKNFLWRNYGGSEGPYPPTLNRTLISHPTFSSGRPNFFLWTKSPHFFYKVTPLFFKTRFQLF